MSSLLNGAACILAFALAAPVAAQEEVPAGSAEQGVPPEAIIKSYQPSEFAQFAPVTALDMVRQVPGFTIQEADARRGLGQAGTNVLINGQRFAGKTNSAVEALARIPAGEVVRIEVVEGSRLNIPGLSGQVLNLVRETRGTTGQFSYGAAIRTDDVGPQLGRFDISVSGGDKRLSWTLAAQNQQSRGGLDGTKRIVDASGRVTQVRSEVQKFYSDAPQVSGSLRFAGRGGQVVNLNGLLSFPDNEFREDSTSLKGEGLGGLELIRDRSKGVFYEVGGDYEFALAPGRLKLLVVHSNRDVPYTSRFDSNFVGGVPTGGVLFSQAGVERETIARGEYGWSAGKADWQVAVEGALNDLGVQSSLLQRNVAGAFEDVDLPGSTLRVDEKRAEGSITFGRPISTKLSLQASAGLELSRLRQAGDLSAARTFVRPKGFMALAWKPETGLDLSAKLERQVGQLNFFDFVASVNVDSNTTNVGNVELVPSQSWIGTFQVNKLLDKLGKLNIRLYYEAINDVIDQIPIGDFGEAPGNIGTARRYGLESTVTLLSEPIGWAGGKLDVKFQLQRSRLSDPLTGRSRPISFDLERDVAVDFRNDFAGTAWAIGTSFSSRRSAPSVRLDSVFTSRGERPGALEAFVENKDVAGLVMRGTLSNFITSNERDVREFFDGRRTDGLAFSEIRDRRYGVGISLSIEGKF